MPGDPCPLTLQNLPDAIRIMNESSRGMSYEWHLDMFGFLNFARYWNVSFEHTLLGYVSGEPASLIVNCTDPEARDAYTIYWGALPQFRASRISLTLFDLSCRKLRDHGYIALHGDSVPDRPVRRYRFIQALPDSGLMDMQAETPRLPDLDPDFAIRPVPLELLSRLALPPGELFHWCQRPSFLRHAAPFLEFLGAFSGDTLQAYAVAHTQATTTSLLDIRSLNSSMPAACALLRHLSQQHYRPPFTATFVREHSFAHRLLVDAGFTIKRKFASLFRDLLATRPGNIRSG